MTDIDFYADAIETRASVAAVGSLAIVRMDTVDRVTRARHLDDASFALHAKWTPNSHCMINRHRSGFAENVKKSMTQ